MALLRLGIRTIRQPCTLLKSSRDLCQNVSTAPAQVTSALQNKKIAFIGAGAMSRAMVSGLLRSHGVSPDQIITSDTNKLRIDAFHSKYRVEVTQNNVTAADAADIIILAVKPQNLDRVALQLQGCIKEDDILFSILAGTSIEALHHAFAIGEQRTCIVRAMPNTPARVGKSMTVWTANNMMTPSQRECVSAIVNCIGKEMMVEDESYMDMVTALSGTGPSYFLLTMEAMIDAGVHLGLPRDMARELVVESMYGTVYLARDTAIHPAMLRERITSPGGTSAAALHACERGNLRTVLSDAIWAAYRRSLEIGGKDSNLGPGRSVNRASIANIDVISNAVEASQMLADRVTVDAEAEDVPVSR